MRKTTVLLILLSLLINLPQSAEANPNRINNSIELALKSIGYSGRHEFDVDVRGSTVRLDGFVSSPEDKERVEKTILAVKGVTVVENNLRILGRSKVRHTESIKKIRDRIKADKSLKNYNLNIEQSGNQVVLSGQVDNSTDKAKIFSIANSVVPLAVIQNNLLIKEQKFVPDSFVNDKVLSALRAENVEGLNGVLINTKDGIVTFSGRVSNHKEIDRMLSIALMVEGVKSVRSEVRVGN